MRLIDADACTKLFDKEFKETMRLIRQGETHLDNLAEGFTEAHMVIRSMPTVDAVKVVRCKDCKHYKEFRTKRNKQIMRLCYRMGKNDMEYSVKPDDFCSYGERSDENAAD